MNASGPLWAQVWPSSIPSIGGGTNESIHQVPALVRDSSDSPVSSTIPTPRIPSADDDADFVLGISRKRPRSESSPVISGGHSDMDTNDLFFKYLNLDLIESSALGSEASWPSSGSGSGVDAFPSTHTPHNPEYSTPTSLDPSLFPDHPFSGEANPPFQNAPINDFQRSPTYATRYADPNPTISPVEFSVAPKQWRSPSAYQQRAGPFPMVENGHYHTAEQQYGQVAAPSGSSYGATPSSIPPRMSVQRNVTRSPTPIGYAGQLAPPNVAVADRANVIAPRAGHPDGTQVGTSSNSNQYPFPLRDPQRTGRPFTFQLANIHHQNPPLWPETHQPPMPSHSHQFSKRSQNGVPPAVSLPKAEGDETILPPPPKRRRVNAKRVQLDKHTDRNTKASKGNRASPTTSRRKRKEMPEMQILPPPQHQLQEQPAPASTQPALFRCRCSDNCQVELPPLVRSVWSKHLRDDHGLHVSRNKKVTCPWCSACDEEMRGDSFVRHIFNVHIKKELRAS